MVYDHYSADEGGEHQMMMETNFVIVPKYATGTVSATPVDVCDQCGGLFIKMGTTGFFIARPHMH